MRKKVKKKSARKTKTKQYTFQLMKNKFKTQNLRKVVAKVKKKEEMNRN
jgi:hypothetical protein